MRFATLVATLVETWSSPSFQGCKTKSQPWSQPGRNHHSRTFQGCKIAIETLFATLFATLIATIKKPRLANFRTFRLRFRVANHNPDRNPVRKPETFWNGGCNQGCKKCCDFDSQPLKTFWNGGFDQGCDQGCDSLRNPESQPGFESQPWQPVQGCEFQKMIATIANS